MLEAANELPPGEPQRIALLTAAGWLDLQLVAGEGAERARELYERKGNVAGARSARELGERVQ